MYLSKSQYMRGLQCAKSLWLKKNKPEILQEPDSIAQDKFLAGNAVGLQATRLFPGGVDIADTNTSFDEKIEKTRQAIDEGLTTIYEATFQFDGILVMVDILHKGENGWEIFEVKSSTKVKDIYIDDVSIQHYVLNGSGIKVYKSSVVYLNKHYVRSGELNVEELFIKEDITAKVQSNLAAIVNTLEHFRSELERTEEPDIEIGPQCKKPYLCDAYDYCWKTQRSIPDFSVFNLLTMGKKSLELYAQSIVEVKDIPEDEISNLKKRVVRDAHLNNKQYIDKKAIKAFLDSIEYPIAHFDFETYTSAIPSLNNTRAGQQIPFQYSLHIEDKKGDLDHKEFLGDGINDPRISLIESMISNMPKRGSIMVYSATFERGRIRELARDFPEYSKVLESYITRLVDLAKPFEERHYYDPKFNGSYSIKVVMPTMVPEMSKDYIELDSISNGADAMSAYPKLCDKALSTIEKDKIRHGLLEYCKLDTYAMVKVLESLRQIVS